MKKMKFLSLVVVLTLSVGMAMNITKTNGIESTENVMTVSGKPLTFTDANFEKNISEGVVLVDFWATWCGPCRRQGPIVEELAQEFAGKVKFGKVDVDHNRTVASKYYIKSIPTLIIFKDGKVMERLVGLRSKDELKKAIKVYL